MKIGVIQKQDIRELTFPEGLLADAIKTHIKKSNFPKKVIIRQLDLLLDKYTSKQEEIATRIIEVKEGNETMRGDIERLRTKTKNMVNELRGKLA